MAQVRANFFNPAAEGQPNPVLLAKRDFLILLDLDKDHESSPKKYIYQFFGWKHDSEMRGRFDRDIDLLTAASPTLPIFLRNILDLAKAESVTNPESDLLRKILNFIFSQLPDHSVANKSSHSYASMTLETTESLIAQLDQALPAMPVVDAPDFNPA